MDFDFHSRSSRPSAVGVMVLLTGMIALAVTLFYMQQTNAAHEAHATEVAALERAQQKRAPVRAKPSRTARADIAELASARVRSNLDYSWQPAFAALEKTRSPKIALVSLEASQTKKQMRLVAESRRLTDAVAFADQLDLQPGIVRTVLMQHEVQEKNAQRPVRFTLVMEMTP